MVETDNNSMVSQKTKTDSTSKGTGEREATLPDPLVLHHSDTPGLTLVNTPLDGRNYGEWSRSMRLSLSAKNKLGLIDGTEKAPPATDARYPLWQCCNNLVITWILHSIQPNIARSVIFSDTAAIEPIACSCDMLKKIVVREEKEKVMQFLMGLNEPYSQARGAILMMNLLPDTRKTHRLILQHERQMKDPSSESLTFTAEEYKQIMALLHGKNGNNQPFANATGIFTPIDTTNPTFLSTIHSHKSINILSSALHQFTVATSDGRPTTNGPDNYRHPRRSSLFSHPSTFTLPSRLQNNSSVSIIYIDIIIAKYINKTILPLFCLSTAKDALVQIKEFIQELQSILRRRYGDDKKLTSEVRKYLTSRKAVRKAIKKALANSKVKKLDSDHESLAMAGIIKGVEEISLTVFESLLSFISGPKAQSKLSSWSLVSKLTHHKRVASKELGETEANEFAKVDAILLSLIDHKICIADVQNQLNNLELFIQDFDEGLECLKRCLIKSRVSFLNP
ncbi:hypothetical protein JRO89_XS09G0171500 [Xanthoceras sorbifolium]|uniref:Retrotransposon Copia-like N-terminal domain-containing protein n=1 Tax=Xanthoceras sorbifolium TaxID=99658 RepID=A0ABQ8HLV4_9ROSI|nr:hypothetical protein JRO89_XS09G0171500 [Xanthoceras sorbifolium]